MSDGASFDEIWCYTCEQIEEYLIRSGAAKRGDTYYTKGCITMLESMPDQSMGAIMLPRTRVRMEGTCAESFHHAFLLNFLSGGG